MKLFFLILAAAISCNSFSQSFALSSTIEVVGGLGNHHPQIEVLNDGTPAVIWTDNVSKNVYFTKHNGVDGFESPQQLNAVGTTVQSYNWSGPDFWMEGDNVYVVYKEEGFSTGHIYLVKSTNNGDSFGDTVRIDNLADGFAQFPDVAVLNDSVWVAFMDHDAAGMNPQYVISRSTDGGATFESEVFAGELWGVEACDCCQPEIVVDEDKVVLLLRNNDADIRDIKGVVSFDRGQTFTQTFSVDDHNWQIFGCPSTGPDARMVSEDELYTAYKTSVGGQARIYLQGYDLAVGATTSGVQIESNSASNAQINYPQIDYNDGLLGIVWEAAGQSIDVFINSSQTGISGVNPDNAFNVTDASGAQNKPDIAVGDGFFHLVYADSDGSLQYVQATALLDVNETELIKLKVHPNPASTTVSVDYPQGVNKSNCILRVYNQQGQEIGLEYNEVDTKLTIVIENIEKGLYHFQLESNGQVYTGDFIKE